MVEINCVLSLGILRHVNTSARRTPLSATSKLSSAKRTLRNGGLLATSAAQHLVDDPALLILQISRRLPMTLRAKVGTALIVLGGAVPGGTGTAALGAFMAGATQRAEDLLTAEQGSSSRLFSEVAVLLDRADLVPSDAPASTRARAAWASGDLSAAVQLLETAGRGETAQGRRLRNELRLLGEGFRLSAPPTPSDFTAAGADEPLRVLHLVTNSLPHTQSGYALRTHNILTGLRMHGIESIALTRTGYPVMIGKPGCADEDEIDGIRYRRTLPSRLGATPEDRLQQEVDEAMRIVGEFRPHVLHATTDYRNALVAQAVSAATGIPWVFEVRGLMEQTWIASHRLDETRAAAASSEKVRSIIATESGLAKEAAAVVTLSRTMADVLENRGVESSSITLIPNGVDQALLAENLSPAQARSELDIDLPSDALAVGAVSALVDYEGHDVLLRAAALLLDDATVPHEVRDRLRIVLVGDGVAAPATKELAKALGLEERLLMPGRVPVAAARTWVQALDLVVVPRKDLEVARTVTPQKPAEAMALGRPVVVSDLPALRETVTGVNGEALGILVGADSPAELATALAGLLQDEARRSETAAQGRAGARERTWPAMMKRYEVAYRAVLMNASEESNSGK